MRNEDFEYLLIKSLFYLPEKSILSQSLPLPQHQVQHQFYQLLMTQVPLDLVQFLLVLDDSYQVWSVFITNSSTPSKCHRCSFEAINHISRLLQECQDYTQGYTA